MKFRKRPIVVDAEQCTEKTIIHTLEGDMIADAGDWIITGVKGEKYPCKSDIFWATYEPAELKVGDRMMLNLIGEIVQDKIGGGMFFRPDRAGKDEWLSIPLTWLQKIEPDRSIEAPEMDKVTHF